MLNLKVFYLPSAFLAAILFILPSNALSQSKEISCPAGGALHTTEPVEASGSSSSYSRQIAQNTAMYVCMGSASVEAFRELTKLWVKAEEICGEGCSRRTVQADFVISGCNEDSTVITTIQQLHHAESKGLAGAYFKFTCRPDATAVANSR